jgi:hypothetical protein
MYRRDTEARSRNRRCREETIGLTYSECVPVASVIRHVMHMRRIIISLASLAVQYFSTLSHKRYDY